MSNNNKGNKKRFESCLPKSDLKDFLLNIPSETGVGVNIHLQAGEGTCDCVPALIKINKGIKPEF